MAAAAAAAAPSRRPSPALTTPCSPPHPPRPRSCDPRWGDPSAAASPHGCSTRRSRCYSPCRIRGPPRASAAAACRSLPAQRLRPPCPRRPPPPQLLPSQLQQPVPDGSGGGSGLDAGGQQPFCCGERAGRGGLVMLTRGQQPFCGESARRSPPGLSHAHAGPNHGHRGIIMPTRFYLCSPGLSHIVKLTRAS